VAIVWDFGFGGWGLVKTTKKSVANSLVVWSWEKQHLFSLNPLWLCVIIIFGGLGR